ncbi:hypothetical protein PR048_020432 [Dryococelus australis]|uniref:Uncharacterized protein n=1 Tax=Dryococelus australis TaxID=614101 RepID=A0ABQ9H6B5_9NEOP|nr:hypothetical protein PR048_020432 [Dryococelus australis]
MSLPLPACILTGTLTTMRPVKLVTTGINSESKKREESANRLYDRTPDHALEWRECDRSSSHGLTCTQVVAIARASVPRSAEHTRDLPSTAELFTAAGGKREIPEKTRRPAASSGTIPTCENPGVARPGIEPGSPWWEASRLTAHPPQLLLVRSYWQIANTPCDFLGSIWNPDGSSGRPPTLLKASRPTSILAGIQVPFPADAATAESSRRAWTRYVRTSIGRRACLQKRPELSFQTTQTYSTKSGVPINHVRSYTSFNGLAALSTELTSTRQPDKSEWWPIRTPSGAHGVSRTFLFQSQALVEQPEGFLRVFPRYARSCSSPYSRLQPSILQAVLSSLPTLPQHGGCCPPIPGTKLASGGPGPLLLSASRDCPARGMAGTSCGHGRRGRHLSLQCQGGMEQRRNAKAGDTGDPLENPPTSGIVRHN